MQLPQFTTRRLMELVVVAAVLLGAAITKQRSKTYRARANHHAASRNMYMWKAKQESGDQAVHDRALAEYHERLHREYRQAVSRPWHSLPPDPPPPK